MHGIDQVEFRVTANPGQPLRPLAKVASGGELSRLSLAVQVSCAARDTRCMIFDEVDAGIGGAVAEIVGRELRALGERRAGHLRHASAAGRLPGPSASARDQGQRRHAPRARGCASSRPAQRVDELARMLGGVEVTAKAREHAGEMLRAAAPAVGGPPPRPNGALDSR